jgi:hypothetical protein
MTYDDIHITLQLWSAMCPTTKTPKVKLFLGSGTAHIGRLFYEPRSTSLVRFDELNVHGEINVDQPMMIPIINIAAIQFLGECKP